jgi:hypothetical protein
MDLNLSELSAISGQLSAKTINHEANLNDAIFSISKNSSTLLMRESIQPKNNPD